MLMIFWAVAGLRRRLRALKSLRFGELDASQIRWNGVSWGKPADRCERRLLGYFVDDLRVQ
jgi:hypothetical protein